MEWQEFNARHPRLQQWRAHRRNVLRRIIEARNQRDAHPHALSIRDQPREILAYANGISANNAFILRRAGLPIVKILHAQLVERRKGAVRNVPSRIDHHGYAPLSEPPAKFRRARRLKQNFAARKGRAAAALAIEIHVPEDFLKHLFHRHPPAAKPFAIAFAQSLWEG